MFLDHDWPGPRREPLRRPPPDKRRTNAATTLIILISAIALGAPIAGATLTEMAISLMSR